MRELERATAFRHDYRRERKGRHKATLDGDLAAIVKALATDAPLDPRLRDDAQAAFSRASSCSNSKRNCAPSSSGRKLVIWGTMVR